ncbi:orotate phosphoribosyltransferase [Coraliomargarita akajimensis]|uniref:Orotate phosphoribosyltransferase n=1 Tax=Coraliomargarita akajimensis (strain DSM 45221 / IAM 15411 / JCM 23193 / KCTC 12865 / 04OKA010-24) TaxID=583355 RepID=D5END0_CORAD|nr:orotate phosphoribosyltransferase [Coraliomargarita akajimensis]ADE55406.1 orotate phosphoribosyltransferase [Coraliomargarita akajimensis DSM 45221]
MNSENDEVLQIFRDSGALLEGHFILRSGLRSGHFFQCAQVCQYMDKVTRLAELLVPKLKDYGATTVVGPAMGGLVIGQEVARQLGLRFLFLEKVDDQLELRRNFKFEPNEKVLIVEDVITRGGRVVEALAKCKEHGADPVAVGVIVDRSQGKTSFEVPHHSLAELSFPTYNPDNLPPELAAIPASKPGS